MATARARGKFITLEGGEGVGKTTSLEHVCERLREWNLDVVSTREPGGTPVGERLRDILLERGEVTVPDDCELLLIFAARAAHLSEVIRPCLARGSWVVCDRFTDATYAYQGGGRGIPESRIAPLEQWVHGDLEPDLTLLFDAAPETGLARARSRGDADRFETEARGFYERVRATYLDRARKHPQRFRVIPAESDIPTVRGHLDGALQELIGDG